MLDIEVLIPNHLIHSSTFSVAITDFEGKYIYVNELFKKRFGFITDDFIGKPFQITIHEDDKEKCIKASEQCIINPEKIVKLQVRKPHINNKGCYWTNWEFSCFKDKDGNPVGIFCLGHDITQNIVLGEKYIELTEKIETIIEEITQAFLILNQNWEIETLNGSAELIFKKSKNELKGLKIWDLLPDNPKNKYPYEFKKVMIEYITVSFEDFIEKWNKHFKIVAYPFKNGISIFMEDITQQKQNLDDLIETKQKLQAVLDSTTDSHVLISPDYKILNFNKVANQNAVELLGKPLIIMDSMWNYVVKGNEDIFYKSSQNALKGEKVIFEKEIFYENANKSVWFEYSYLPTFDINNNIIGFSFNVSNVDSRKKAEEKLKQSEIMLKAINNSINKAIILINAEKIILYYNNNAIEFIEKISGKEIKTGLNLFDFYFFGEHFKDFVSYHERVLNQGETLTTEILLNDIWWQFNFNPVLDDDNKIFGIAVNIKNITNKKLLDLELKETKLRLDKTIEAVPHPLLIIDAKTNIITYVNHEFEKTFGLASKEVIGKNIDILLNLTNETQKEQIKTEFFKNEGIIKNAINSVGAFTKFGNEIFLDISINTFKANENKYIIAILQNITEKKKQHDTILKQNIALRNIAWQQSHVMRRPVANLLALCELFSDEDTDEFKNKYLKHIKDEVLNLDAIIRKIVDLTYPNGEKE